MNKKMTPEDAFDLIIRFATGDLDEMQPVDRVAALLIAAMTLVEISVADIAEGSLEDALAGIDAVHDDLKQVMPARCARVREAWKEMN